MRGRRALAAIVAALLAPTGVHAARAARPGSGSAEASRPVTLQVSEQEGRVVVTVVGLSDEPVNARFVLETVSGGSRTVQRGVALIEANRPTSLTTTSVSSRPGWSATLTVEPLDGEPYVLRAGDRSV